MKKYLKLKINKIKYVKEIIKNYPGINSGRKNYYDQLLRVLKNNGFIKLGLYSEHARQDIIKAKENTKYS